MPRNRPARAGGHGAERNGDAEDFERERRSGSGQQIARDAADHRHQGADGEIEAAGEHRHGLRHGDQGQREHLVGVLHEHRRGKALRVGEVVEKIDDDEQAERGEEGDVLARAEGEVRHERSSRTRGVRIRAAVMPGLVPGIHAARARVESGCTHRAPAWMAGTSPAMTEGCCDQTCAASSTLSELATMLVSVISAPFSSRTMRPSYMMATRSQQPINSS